MVILYLGSLDKYLLLSKSIHGSRQRLAYVKGLVSLVAEYANILAGLLCRLLDLGARRISDCTLSCDRLKSAHFHAMFIGTGAKYCLSPLQRVEAFEDIGQHERIQVPNMWCYAQSADSPDRVSGDAYTGIDIEYWAGNVVWLLSQGRSRIMAAQEAQVVNSTSAQWRLRAS